VENIEGLSKKELKAFILHQLDEAGVDHEMVEIKVSDGPKVILIGEVPSRDVQQAIRKIITTEVGIEDIVDGLIVVEGMDGDFEYEDSYGANDLADPDEDFIGTEDIFRSIEDGIPYIPPTTSSFGEDSSSSKWKKRRKKKR